MFYEYFTMSPSYKPNAIRVLPNIIKWVFTRGVATESIEQSGDFEIKKPRTYVRGFGRAVIISFRFLFYPCF